MSQRVFSKGTLALKGPKLNELAEIWRGGVPAEAQANQQERDKSVGFHVTVITTAEIKDHNISRSMIEEVPDGDVQVDAVGLAIVEKGSQSVVCSCLLFMGRQSTQKAVASTARFAHYVGISWWRSKLWKIWPIKDNHSRCTRSQRTNYLASG